VFESKKPERLMKGQDLTEFLPRIEDDIASHMAENSL